MDIRVSGHQVETGDALRTHVETRLQAIADKYFSRALSAHVTFGRGPHDHGFVCDIVAHVMQGVVLKGGGRGQEAHPSFDEAAEKIEKQLRRYKRRLKDKHGVATAMVRAEENAAYIENWAVKYAAQIAAHNEMLESHGLWNDEFRAF